MPPLEHSNGPFGEFSCRANRVGGRVYIYRALDGPPCLVGVYSQRSGGVHWLTRLSPGKDAAIKDWLLGLFPPRRSNPQPEITGGAAASVAGS